MNAKGQDVIYTFTFYRLGPSFITWFYPIDQTPIEKEILDPMGQIGTEDFEDFPGAIEHLNPFDPKWFLKEENELVCQLLIENLVYLSDVFGMNGAYSLQAALAKDPDESIFRYRLGAIGGRQKRAARWECCLLLSPISMARCQLLTTKRLPISIDVPLRSSIVSMPL